MFTVFDSLPVDDAESAAGLDLRLSASVIARPRVNSVKDGRGRWLAGRRGRFARRSSFG